ncbi:CRISPR-associated endoribonuclease Cas6 [Venenivibrio stagnispumantis]|uniref:CRISPR-associated endoribonuclease n=1 Tax=Venenivibrio stagnispumantis TaxID=407998 RepID=A0AA45WJV9_9AQUI|nr:CRISPR-associated endoribonuclease Cas6 [Venenivibrio stagnispumantis]MCW4572912.1 CRISPR-associated endoribonuclease Cas6 [Venenivibrio stagnispumantis]SMP04450.1 CRISPR-associated endoribonuclease Cas6 [Venenivibrio stagnispumantis]
MRLKISFSADKEYIYLPIHHNEYIQGMLYGNLPEPLAKYLHDIGFFYNNRAFKLFTFSKIYSEQYFPLLKDKKIKYKSPISIYISSAIEEIPHRWGENFIRKDRIFLGKNNLYLQEIEIQKQPEFKEEFYIKTLSPITVYRTIENDKKYYKYYSPSEKDFAELIKINLTKKYNLITGENIEEFPIDIKPAKDIKKVLFKYKDFPIEAYEGIFKIKTNPDMFKVVYDAGLGAKNSQGFGMIEVMSEID